MKTVRWIGFMALVLSLATACSGHGNGDPSTNATPGEKGGAPTPASSQTTPEPVTQKNPEAANWEVTSRVHYTEGIITDIHQSGDYADAITIKVETGYPSDNDPLEKPLFQPGQAVTFHLLTMVQVTPFHLEKGKEVIIKNSQFTPKGSETPLWGGDIIGYQRDGKYVDLNGNPANYTMSEHAKLKDGKLVVVR